MNYRFWKKREEKEKTVSEDDAGSEGSADMDSSD